MKAQHLREAFSISTDDGAAQLHGEFMLPEASSPMTGALLIVPGGWFADRDGFMGDSYTEADLMYLRIARRIRDSGFVVARYDNRGVTGNEFRIGLTSNRTDPVADTERYLKTCIDADIRRSVTAETLAADSASVFRYVAERRGVDPGSIVVFAHSEGGLHVARSIGNGTINPKGIVFAGTTILSPVANMKWQMVDRYVQEVLGWDRDHDGRVSDDDVAQAFGDSFLAEVGFSEEALHPNRDHWSQAELSAYFADGYENEKRVALSAADDAPYPCAGYDDQRYVVASNRWYKQWFVDETPTLDLLCDYHGRIALHYGEIDRQVSIGRETDYIETFTGKMIREPKVVIHRSRGHAFAFSKPFAGPMDDESEDVLAGEIVAMLRAGSQCDERGDADGAC